VVEIHRIKSIKQIVLYMRFIDTAAEQISECRGQFEILSPASQTALLNVAFVGEFLRIPDLKAFSDRIKHYFSMSQTFTRMLNHWEGIDSELMNHCHVLKMQRVSPYELSQYYIEYMKRHVLEADPKVVKKMQMGEYSKDLSAGYGGINAAEMWQSPAEVEKKKMELLQMQLNMQQQGGLNQQGGFNYGQPGGHIPAQQYGF